MQELGKHEGGPQNVWNERHGNGGELLPEAAVGTDSPPDPSIVSGADDEMLPRDVQRKTAYYDYAADKQMSQTDSKLFYQRSQLEAQKTGGSNWGHSQTSPNSSPVMMPRSVSTMFEQDAGRRRSGSVNSMKSGNNPAPR